MNRFLLLLLLHSLPLCAFGFQLEKQKLKLALEYENYQSIQGSEIRTTGLEATYLLKARGALAEKIHYTLDYQTGVKTNFYRDFQAGELSPLIWSNRFVINASVPVDRLYFGGSFYFRNKWLAEVEENQFIDIFGGVGFRELAGSGYAGWQITRKWDISASIQKSDLNFAEFPLSNSNWIGASVRISNKLSQCKLNLEYRLRNVDYNRPVFPFSVRELQKDHFQEIGASVEFLRPFYFSGGYSYQDNDSNNPGFSYFNHRVTLLIGTELTHDFHLQAYGIVQRQTFLEAVGELQFPLLLEENANNTMAASLVRTLSESRELEFGVQRFSYNSPFAELDASKYILYAAFNFRF